MRVRSRAIAALAAAGALAVPATASADQSALGGYGQVGGVTQSDIDGGNGHDGSATATKTVARAHGTDSGSGNLPFTGFDALAVGAVGVLLAGAGVSLRRLSRDSVV
jgi:hypothetical protein